MKTIIYLCYGKKDFFYEVLLSIASILKYKKSDIQIVVYTDNPNFFQDWPVKTVLISMSDIKEWSGASNFMHRCKIFVLKRGFQDFSNCIYIDTDTYFTADPMRLFSKIDIGKSIMFQREGFLRSWGNTKIADFCDKNKITLKGRLVSISPGEQEMWNAGVIGIHPDEVYLLDDIIELTDILYEGSNHNLCEQFSVTYILNAFTNVSQSYKILEHYCLDLRPRKLFHEKMHREMDRINSYDLQKKIDFLYQIRPRLPYHVRTIRRFKIFIKNVGIFRKGLSFR